MRLHSLFLACGIVLSISSTCNRKQNVDEPKASEPIDIVLPAPLKETRQLTLDEEQMGCVQKGNAFALRCLRGLYNQNGGANLVVSPLSLQYALAMAMNGASGETAREISAALGYGSNIQALNEYMSVLMEQLPEVDTTVKIKLVNAMLADRKYRVKPEYSSILNSLYYAPVQYVSGDKDDVVDLINEWASKSTNGFIDNVLDKGDISGDFVAALLNAIYFKAKWAPVYGPPLFLPGNTMLSRPFYLDNGKQTSVDYMKTSEYLQYAHRDGYQVLQIPYAKYRFAMIFLLPDEKGGNSLEKLLGSLTSEEWNDLTRSIRTGPEVHLQLPKFDFEKRYKMAELLQGLGVKTAFMPGRAEFDRMLESEGKGSFWLNEVIQKARISVNEWGTEAAAVTVEDWVGAAMPIEHKEVYFTADHPFAFFITELSSGAILFEGTFTGK